MAKPQTRKPASKEAVRDHGVAVAASVRRLTFHTGTFPLTEGTGHDLDRRIIIQEASGMMARLTAILAILAEVD